MKEMLKKVSFGNMAVGAVAIIVLGFGTGMVTFSSSAQTAAAVAAKTAVVAALTPYCVAKANADPQLEARLSELKDAGYKQITKIEEYGWAVLPGSDKSNRDVARQCMEEVLA